MNGPSGVGGAIRADESIDQKWLRQLQTACTLLSTTDESIVRSVSLVLPRTVSSLAAAEAEAEIDRWLEVVRTRVTEYGVGARVTSDGRSATIQLFRSHARHHPRRC
jgi:hypothetical protein